MRLPKTLAAIGAALTLTLTACGSDYDSDLVDALKAQGASQEEAECFIDELGEDDAQAFVDNADATEPPDNAEEILAALDECGVEPDGPSPEDEPEGEPESPETSAAAAPDEEEAAGADLDALAGCLEGEGLDVSVDDGPPARIDIIGSAGSGAVFDYGDEAVATDATDQFIETFGGGEGDFTTSSSGTLAFYYLNSQDEAEQVQGCLNG